MKLTLLGQILTGALVLHQSFVVALLLSRREERKDHSLAMAVFFLANLITSLPDLVSFFRPGLQVAPYDLMTMPFAVLLGPALYFYARALVSPDPVRPSRQDLRHLGPSAATGLLVAGLLGFNGFPADQQFFVAPANRALLFNIVAACGLLGIFVVATSVYVVKTLRLLFRYRRSRFDFFSAVEGRSLTWFEWMIGISALTWAVHLVMLVFDSSDFLQMHPDARVLIETVWVYALSFMVLWQQVIFKPERHWTAKAADVVDKSEKYQRSALDEERARRIAAKIERAMTDDRLYRNQGITLRQLSNHTQVPENYLSQVLNEILGRSFYEFINHWRIRDACVLLGEAKFSIIEVCEEVGFNSRSTFNAAFKKETGISPSEFRAAARSGASPVVSLPEGRTMDWRAESN
ncbi:MAG: helix-turn-helix domain-containing protein [Bradyrhizobium sp.]|nr:helix-turn-helix transcriptional regulator [Bradyrhizobium sp.]